MKSRSKWFFVSLFILSLGGIGMVILYQQRAQEETELTRHEQERMALYLVNHYEGVEEIEFQDFYTDQKTGYVSSQARVNNESTVTIFSAGIDGNISVDYHTNFKLKRSENKLDITLDTIKLKYNRD
ncbi:hypothetical protein [Streptococcus sp. DD13]|uniref:hypothetical protein n=1 Tax=Streptococcus sp. DD13 TaxID=1777881 RepID=UPI000832D80F|nr:hypothetical protein [Streptococcus sp. DD13]